MISGTVVSRALWSARISLGAREAFRSDVADQEALQDATDLSGPSETQQLALARWEERGHALALLTRVDFLDVLTLRLALRIVDIIEVMAKEDMYQGTLHNPETWALLPRPAVVSGHRWPWCELNCTPCCGATSP
jgi:hypothetical protein